MPLIMILSFLYCFKESITLNHCVDDFYFFLLNEVYITRNKQIEILNLPYCLLD